MSKASSCPQCGDAVKDTYKYCTNCGRASSADVSAKVLETTESQGGVNLIVLDEKSLGTNDDVVDRGKAEARKKSLKIIIPLAAVVLVFTLAHALASSHSQDYRDAFQQVSMNSVNPGLTFNSPSEYCQFYAGGATFFKLGGPGNHQDTQVYPYFQQDFS